MWKTYTGQFGSAMRKSEVMTCTREWIELEISMLSEISQTHKDKYCVFLCMQNRKVCVCVCVHKRVRRDLKEGTERKK